MKRSRLQKSSSQCARQPIQKKRTYFSLQDLEDRQEQEHEKVKSISDGPGNGILKRSKLQKSSSKCDLQPIQKRHTYFPLQDEEDSEEQEHETVESFSGGPRKGILKRSNLQKSSSSGDGQLVKKRRTYIPLLDDEDQQENENLGDSLQTKTNTSDPLPDEITCSNSHGKSVTRKETRALTQTTKRQGKLAFEVDECAGRIVGEDSQVFITKGGCVMRQFAKFDGTTWRKQSPLLKTNIISKCTENSSYDPNCRLMVHAIQTQLASQHRNKQYRLHNYYKTFLTKEEATTHPPNGIKVPDLVNLSERFASEDFQKISTRNKKKTIHSMRFHRLLAQFQLQG